MLLVNNLFGNIYIYTKLYKFCIIQKQENNNLLNFYVNKYQKSILNLLKSKIESMSGC